MTFPRTKLRESFAEFFLTNEKQYICLFGVVGSGKTTFLSLLRENTAFGDSFEQLYINKGDNLENISLQNENIPVVLIDGDESIDYSMVRRFVAQHNLNSTIVFVSNTIQDYDEVNNFMVPGISFREYAEGNALSIDITKIFAGESDIKKLNLLKEAYLHTGQFGEIINTPELLDTLFEEKLSEMNQELFEKEYESFLEFIRTVAMGVGDLFKEERIAKLMNISRRKVRKYTEVLVKHNFVEAIGPFAPDESKELSRHVKLYFSDLSFLCGALGVAYYHGSTKQGVLENFVFLELQRKITKTHDIRFYRKKSGADISFVLVNKETQELTPIVITPKSTNIIPAALKSFDETYHEQIEHSMILNDDIVEKKDFEGKTLLVLPHIAI